MILSLKDTVTPVCHYNKKRNAELSPPSPDFKDDLLQKLSSLIDEKMSTFGECQTKEIQKNFSSNIPIWIRRLRNVQWHEKKEG